MNKWWTAVVVLLAAACGGSPYDGYKTVAPDVDVRMIALGDGERTVLPSDCVLVRLRASQRMEATGSYLSTEQWYAASDLRRGAFTHVLKRLHEGDSLSLITTYNKVPWSILSDLIDGTLPDTSRMSIDISLRSLRSLETMEADRERHRRNDPESFELALMQAYRDRSGEQWERWGTSDMYYRLMGRPVDTTQVTVGDVVWINYTGRRVEDGQVFDHNGYDGKPFGFRYGDPHQVINGLEVAITLLREGRTGAFLIPSSMAFGERGLSGVVEPWTPVLYHLELEKVDRGATRKPIRSRGNPG